MSDIIGIKLRDSIALSSAAFVYCFHNVSGSKLFIINKIQESKIKVKLQKFNFFRKCFSFCKHTNNDMLAPKGNINVPNANIILPIVLSPMLIKG